MKRGIKAIIFDVGGVLALGKVPLKKYKGKLHSLGVHEEIAKKLKISVDQWFDSIDTIYTKSIGGKITYERVLKIIAKNNKTSTSKIKKLITKAYKKNFKQNKELFKQAFQLKKQGYKIAVLSDQWHLSKEALMPEKLYNKFDKLIVSCDVGMRKPDTKIYRLTLKKLKIKPSEAIFIDNQEWNIESAKKLGIKIILFKDNKQCFNELDKLLK